MLFVWVALGGALGSVARLLMSQGVSRVMGDAFPYGILFVNIFGSFVMGLVMALLMRKVTADPSMQMFLTTGILGGFTTFSAFSFDVFKLVNSGQTTAALVYVLASVFVSIAAVFIGFRIMTWGVA
jgi:fluoride exporter